MRPILFYVILYAGLFLVLHRVVGFRRWWYGAVGALSALILTLTSQLLALGIWPTLLAALLVVGLNLAILRDLRIL